MEMKTILGIYVPDRLAPSVDVQKAFTDYGCTPYGLILLEMVGEPEEIAGLKSKLQAIEGIQVQAMEFSL